MEVKYNKDGSIAKKRGRPKKVVISEEVDILTAAIKKQEEQEFQEALKEELAKRKQEQPWDIKKGEPITYFDKRLSYELTGYKPITEELGLDFNPEWFTKARDTYLKTGHYTQFRLGTKAYADFWDEEYRRCRDGYTVNGYTLTGPNYYYLNYYQLPNIDVEKAGSGRLAIFPKFLVFQYEFFHYFELCRILKKDAVLMKARGVG